MADAIEEWKIMKMDKRPVHLQGFPLVEGDGDHG